MAAELNIEDEETLKRVRAEHTERLEKQEKMAVKGDYMKLLETTRIDKVEIEREKKTTEEKLAILNLQKVRLDLLTALKSARSSHMQSYYKDVAPCGKTVTQCVERLFEIFRGCRNRAEYDEYAAMIYGAKPGNYGDMTPEEQEDSDRAQKELKTEVNPLRQSVIAWWKDLHDMYTSFGEEMPDFVPTVDNLPGHGRAAAQMKMLMTLDCAIWVFSMKMKIEDWYVKGKSSMYTWIEGILEADKKWSAEFKC